MKENKYVVFSGCGQPQECLDVTTGPTAIPAEGELMVRMLASPINPADINFVQGVYGIKPTFPNARGGLEG